VGFQVGVTEEDLDGVEIDTGFEKMCSEGMSQPVWMNILEKPAFCPAFWHARNTAGEMGHVGSVPGNSQPVGRRVRQ
jgi:hypothetical protein